MNLFGNDQNSDILVESDNGKPVLFLPVSKPIRLGEVFAERRQLSRVMPDTKNPGTQVRTSGYVEELLQIPMFLSKKTNDIVEADIVLGNILVHPSGFHLSRSFVPDTHFWQLEISHAILRGTHLFGTRFLLTMGKHQTKLTALFKRIDELSADGALVLPENIDTEIASIPEIETGSYDTPLIDIDHDGHVQWLLPVFAEPMEFEFRIHPGEDTIL